jgi:hypothetical protein
MSPPIPHAIEKMTTEYGVLFDVWKKAVFSDTRLPPADMLLIYTAILGNALTSVSEKAVAVALRTGNQVFLNEMHTLLRCVTHECLEVTGDLDVHGQRH